MGEIPIRGTGQLVLPQSMRDNQVIAKSPVTVAEPAPVKPAKSIEPASITAPARSDFDPSITLPAPADLKANLNVNLVTFDTGSKVTALDSTSLFSAGASVKSSYGSLSVPTVSTNFGVANLSTQSYKITSPDLFSSKPFWDFMSFGSSNKSSSTITPPTKPDSSSPVGSTNSASGSTTTIQEDNNFSLIKAIENYDGSFKDLNTSYSDRKTQIDNIIKNPKFEKLSEADAKVFKSASETLLKMQDPDYIITPDEHTTMDSLTSVVTKNKDVLGLKDDEISQIDTLKQKSKDIYAKQQVFVNAHSETEKNVEALVAKVKNVVARMDVRIKELENMAPSTRTQIQNYELAVLEKSKAFMESNVLNSAEGMTRENYERTLMIVGPAIEKANAAIEHGDKFDFVDMQKNINSLEISLTEATTKPLDPSKMTAFLDKLKSSYGDSSPTFKYFSNMLSSAGMASEAPLSIDGGGEGSHPTMMISGAVEAYKRPETVDPSTFSISPDQFRIGAAAIKKYDFKILEGMNEIPNSFKNLSIAEDRKEFAKNECIIMFMAQFDAVDMGKWALTADSRKTLDQQITDQGQASLERSNAITNTDINEKIKHVDVMQTEVQSAYDNFDSSKANISDLLRTFREINVKVNNAIAEVHAGTRARTGIDENNTKERKDNRRGWDKADSLAKVAKMFNEKARETILRNGTPSEKEQFIKSEKELALYGESGRVSI